KLLSICPHCVRTISEDWREFGEAPPVEHHSQFLARHRSRLPASLLGGDAVFHDPCYLGRYRDVYDEPRAVLGQYATLVEAGRSRERSFCCGAGGGLVFGGEEEGKRISVERAEQLAATGASTVAAACPFCHTMFRDAFSGMEGAPRLLDVAQIAASSLGEKAR
ncbi:MAG: (Fe-S)-binding protein, partial [bacterium]|nr:(Fe-S)-binding protein [bacterium]